PQGDLLAQGVQRWQPLPRAYHLTRWKNVLHCSFYNRRARSWPEEASRYLLQLAQRQLGPDVDMRHCTPDYKPWDQRVCAGPDGALFHMLRAGQLEVVTDTIERCTPAGIQLSSCRQ